MNITYKRSGVDMSCIEQYHTGYKNGEAMKKRDITWLFVKYFFWF